VIADQVVVTVPLAILKSKDIKFVPELPKTKVNAIDRLGCSYLDKLFLEFDEVFWDNSCDYFNYISD
jgi:lysine-specific histone demethylase 1